MRSMTGFGQAAWQAGGKRLAVEVRSVNQRFLDVRLNLPREYQQHEEALRKIVQAAVERGKVLDCAAGKRLGLIVRSTPARYLGAPQVNEGQLEAVRGGSRIALNERLGVAKPGRIGGLGRVPLGERVLDVRELAIAGGEAGHCLE